ncbi:hypothetical protein CPB84DRAFT_1777271 [Gymnopilus junonius]|uniref:Uncharacterized protein n=1 Tax=Gymnopilus junonius TaxID=109634 RepID=A0A9P5TNL6_GYMJU|nr:hypothetical protein CPB84DRAFT_1777271 [Gymnopilus junonius]
MLYVVLRDNFLFFVCAFALYILTATTWLAANPRYFTVPGSFSCSLTSIMGCRLIINLCEAYHHPRDFEETGSPPRSIWAATTKHIQFISMNPASKSMASGIPPWRHTRSQRGQILATDLPSSRHATVPCISYDMAGARVAARGEAEGSGTYEMCIVACMPENIPRPAEATKENGS